MATPFKKTQKNYQKFIFGLKANFYAKFEENLETWTYHLFFILHESYVNLYLKPQYSFNDFAILLKSVQFSGVQNFKAVECVNIHVYVFYN